MVVALATSSCSPQNPINMAWITAALVQILVMENLFRFHQPHLRQLSLAIPVGNTKMSTGYDFSAKEEKKTGSSAW